MTGPWIPWAVLLVALAFTLTLVVVELVNALGGRRRRRREVDDCAVCRELGETSRHGKEFP